MRTRNKRIAALLMTSMLAMAAVSPMQAMAEENSVEMLTIGMTKDQSTITPFTYINGTPGFDVMRFIYDSLFTIDENNVAVPWMVADDYEVSEDFRTYKVTLLDGIKWQDGEPLTAEDVKFTFEYVLTQENGRGLVSHPALSLLTLTAM